jgi:hypothetical protein
MNPQECPFQYGAVDHADGAFGITNRSASIPTTAPSSIIMSLSIDDLIRTLDGLDLYETPVT